jgi:pilus assembly protein Flp/PilA
MKFFKKLLRDEAGATAIEYGLIAALIAVAAITAMGPWQAAEHDLHKVSDEMAGETTANRPIRELRKIKGAAGQPAAPFLLQTVERPRSAAADDDLVLLPGHDLLVAEQPVEHAEALLPARRCRPSAGQASATVSPLPAVTTSIRRGTTCDASAW